MSTSAHNAPLHTLNKSKSNRSLYTENSQDSEVDRVWKQNVETGNGQPRRQEPISQKISKLPTILPQVNEKAMIVSKQRDQQKSNIYDGIPILPKGNSHRYKNAEDERESNSFQLGRPGGPQFNTIAVTSLDRDSRNQYGEFNNAMHLTGMSGVPPRNESDRSRMLRSSQGGRWFRSQSLMQDKGEKAKLPGNFSNFQSATRNFHKHESKYAQRLQEYMKFYMGAQKQMQQKKDIYYKYKVNLENSVEEIKNKMENYLQSRIDLSNLPIDRPDADWGQDQLMKFYTNYQKILNHRFQNLEASLDAENNSKVMTVLKKYKNCSYYGPVKDGKKHGFGYLHYFSGRFYEGLFDNDQKVKGFQMDDAELYLGEYEKNQRHGEGILKTNQFLLSGIFNYGQFKLDGNMKMRSTGFSKNEQKNIENELRNNVVRKGFKIQFSSIVFYVNTEIVIEKNNNGDVYIGEVNQDGQKNGEGLEIFQNGDLYIGRYQQGAPEGYGEYYWDSGAFYRGNFLTGMRHGKGIWAMIHGDRYEGDYLNDKKNGRGMYVWKSGDKYEGEFENDYRHGYGEMYWRDGSSFKGQWLNGIEINKTFKIGGQKISEVPGKNNFKTVQTRTRVVKKEQIKSVSRSSKNSNVIPQTQSQAPRNPYLEKNNRIPLQKLKSMLNPSNSIN